MGKWFVENLATAVISAVVGAVIALAVVWWLPSPGDVEREIHASLHASSKSLLKLLQPAANMTFDADMGNIPLRVKRDANLQLIPLGLVEEISESGICAQEGAYCLRLTELGNRVRLLLLTTEQDIPQYFGSHMLSGKQ